MNVTAPRQPPPKPARPVWQTKLERYAAENFLALPLAQQHARLPELSAAARLTLLAGLHRYAAETGRRPEHEILARLLDDAAPELMRGHGEDPDIVFNLSDSGRSIVRAGRGLTRRMRPKLPWEARHHASRNALATLATAAGPGQADVAHAAAEHADGVPAAGSDAAGVAAGGGPDAHADGAPGVD